MVNLRRSRRLPASDEAVRVEPIRRRAVEARHSAYPGRYDLDLTWVDAVSQDELQYSVQAVCHCFADDLHVEVVSLSVSDAPEKHCCDCRANDDLHWVLHTWCQFEVVAHFAMSSMLRSL